MLPPGCCSPAYRVLVAELGLLLTELKFMDPPELLKAAMGDKGLDFRPLHFQVLHAFKIVQSY